MTSAAAISAAAVVVSIASYWAVPLLFDRVSRAALARRAAQTGSFVVTCDDGPGKTLTPLITRLLSKHNAKATFFLLGRNMAGNEDAVENVRAAGHEIASHGFEHLNHWKVSPLAAVRDIRRGWEEIDRVLGTTNGVYPFRPPEGKLNLASLGFLLWKRAPIVYWTVDSGDTWTGGKPRNPRKVADFLRKHSGAVALYHDFDRKSAATRLFVLRSMARALRAAEEAGLQSATVGEVLWRTPTGKGG